MRACTRRRAVPGADRVHGEEERQRRRARDDLRRWSRLGAPAQGEACTGSFDGIDLLHCITAWVKDLPADKQPGLHRRQMSMSGMCQDENTADEALRMCGHPL